MLNILIITKQLVVFSWLLLSICKKNLCVPWAITVLGLLWLKAISMSNGVRDNRNRINCHNTAMYGHHTHGHIGPTTGIQGVQTNSLAVAERPCDILLCFRLTSSFIRRIIELHCILGNPMGASEAIQTLYVNVLTQRKKLDSRVLSVLFEKQWSSVSEPPSGGLRSNVCDSSLARRKARSRLPVGYN